MKHAMTMKMNPIIYEKRLINLEHTIHLLRKDLGL